MKRKIQSEVPPLPKDDLGPPEDLSLPVEAPLRPEEAAEAVDRAQRLLEPGRPASSAEKDVEKDGGTPAPVAPIPWPPMRPDETPS